MSLYDIDMSIMITCMRAFDLLWEYGDACSVNRDQECGDTCPFVKIHVSPDVYICTTHCDFHVCQETTTTRNSRGKLCCAITGEELPEFGDVACVSEFEEEPSCPTTHMKRGRCVPKPAQAAPMPKPKPKGRRACALSEQNKEADSMKTLMKAMGADDDVRAAQWSAAVLDAATAVKQHTSCPDTIPALCCLVCRDLEYILAHTQLVSLSNRGCLSALQLHISSLNSPPVWPSSSASIETALLQGRVV